VDGTLLLRCKLLFLLWTIQRSSMKIVVFVDHFEVAATMRTILDRAPILWTSGAYNIAGLQDLAKATQANFTFLEDAISGINNVLCLFPDVNVCQLFYTSFSDRVTIQSKIHDYSVPISTICRKMGITQLDITMIFSSMRTVGHFIYDEKF
jgi:hypothetical protein